MSLNTQILIAAILGVVFGFILNLFPDSTFFSASLYGIGINEQYFYWFTENAADPANF